MYAIPSHGEDKGQSIRGDRAERRRVADFATSPERVHPIRKAGNTHLWRECQRSGSGGPEPHPGRSRRSVAIDAQFRAIASLNKIIVRLCSGHPAPPVRDFLQGLGWIVLVGGG